METYVQLHSRLMTTREITQEKFFLSYSFCLSYSLFYIARFAELKRKWVSEWCACVTYSPYVWHTKLVSVSSKTGALKGHMVKGHSLIPKSL